MEPTPVPRTPVSQRIGAAAAAESKEDAADAGATVHAQQDCVDTWSTDKIDVRGRGWHRSYSRSKGQKKAERARALFACFRRTIEI